MTRAARDRTFDDIVRQAHAERARYVGELLATVLLAVAEGIKAGLRWTAQTLSPQRADRWSQQHGRRQQQQRAAQSRRMQLLPDVGR